MQIDLTKSKVVCGGRNYVKHIHELNNEVPDNSVILIKPNSSITKTIKLSSTIEAHYECEIVFAFDNNSNIKAVGLGLDLTDRNLQLTLKAKWLPRELAKAFDSSTVISKFIAINSEDIAFLNFKTHSNTLIPMI